MIRFPAPLRPGDRIGVTSPSSGVEGAGARRIEFCVEWLRSRGYEVEQRAGAMSEAELVEDRPIGPAEGEVCRVDCKAQEVGEPGSGSLRCGGFHAYPLWLTKW